MPVEISHLYLVSVQLNADGTIQKGSARPIGNTFITLENQDFVSIDKDQTLIEILKQPVEKARQLYLTDANGSISNFISGKNSGDTNQPNKYAFSTRTNAELSNKAELYMPPAHLIHYSFAANGYAKWLPKLHKQIDKIVNSSTNLQPKLELDIRHIDIESDFEDPENTDSIEYKKWCIENKASKIKALCLPRVRAFMVKFSHERYLGAEVKITNRQGQQVFYADIARKKNQTTVVELEDLNGQIQGYCAVFFDLDNHFNPSADSAEQIYQFTISPKEYELDLNNKDNNYRLVERLRFPIKTIAGDFDVINGDAFSLEESLVRQFPLRYPNIIKNISDQQNNPTVIKGTESLLHAFNTNQDKLKLVGGAYTADSTAKFLRIIGLGFYNSIKEDNESLKLLRGSINLAFNVYDLTKQTIEAKNIAIKHYAEGASTAVRSMARSGALNAITDGTPPESLWSSAVADNVDDIIDDIHEVVLPSKLKKAFKASQVIVDNLGKGMDLYSVFNDTQGVFVAYNRMKSTVNNTNKIFTDYAYKVHFNDMESKDTNELTRQELDESKSKLISFQNEHKNTAQVTQIGDVKFINISFAFDRAGFAKDNSFDSLIDFLNSIRLPFDLILAGHTCSIGTASYNLELSRRRALSVEKILLAAGVGQSSPVNITIRAYGESKPIASNANENNRKKNRRVDAVIILKKVGRFKPSREGMESVEKYRALSSINKAEMGDSVSKAVVSTLDLIAGIPPTNLAHLAFSLLWTAGGVLSDGANLLNNAVFGEAFLKAANDFNQHDSLSAANQTLLLEGTEFNKNINAGYYLETQMRLRAEALSGLMQLLMRCSIETNDIKRRLKFDIDNINEDSRTSFSYVDNLEFYRVKEYVETFILSDGWKLFAGALHPVALDDYWLYLIKTNDLEAKVKSSEDQSWQAEKLQLAEDYAKRTLSYADLVKDNIIDAAGDLMLSRSFISNNVLTLFHQEREYLTTARFQEFFPVHYSQNETLDELFLAAKPDFSDLDEDVYLGMMHSVKEAGGVSTSWTSMSAWLENKRKNKPGWVSPLDEIRICILLNPDSGVINDYIKNGTITYLPYKVFPTRVDGLNMSGPANDGFIRKLKYSDLTSDERKLLGKHEEKDVEDTLYGAIIYPFFKLGKKTIHGTKPLANAVSAWLNVSSEHALGGIYNWDHRWDMIYKYEVMLGYNSATLKNICYKKKVTKGRMRGAYYPYEFPYAIWDGENSDSPYKGEATLLDRHFLQVGIEEKEALPPLFINPDVFCLLNTDVAAAGSYDFSEKDWYKNSSPPNRVKLNSSVLTLPEFTWEDEVEIVVLVVCDALDDKAYDKRLLKTDSIPAQIQLMREGINPTEKVGMHVKSETPWTSAEIYHGPKYDAALLPLGNIVKSRANGLEFEWSKEVAGDDYTLLEGHLAEPVTLQMLSGLKIEQEDKEHKESSGNLADTLANALIDVVEEQVDNALDGIADTWDDFTGNSLVKPVYAARVVLNYQNLLGEIRNGIKPFAINPFDKFNQDHDGLTDEFWKLCVRVTSAGESGVENIVAKGRYNLPYPHKLSRKNSHWYRAKDKDIASANAIIESNKKIAEDHKAKEVSERPPTHPISPLMQWVADSPESAENFSSKQKEIINTWLLKQGNRKVLSMTDHEVIK